MRYKGIINMIEYIGYNYKIKIKEIKDNKIDVIKIMNKYNNIIYLKYSRNNSRMGSGLSKYNKTIYKNKIELYNNIKIINIKIIIISFSGKLNHAMH